MKKFPILYSRAATGAVQQWQIIADGDAFYTIAGQVGGKLTQTAPNKCVAKNVGRANETNVEEQAIAEAQSKWDKKLKTGNTPDINKVDTCISYIEPMLAKNFEDYESKLNWKAGLFVQNKYNGVRCVATFENDAVVFKSRKGEVWRSVPHINKDLQEFFEKYPDAVLDGELYNYELRQRLNDLNSIASTKKEKNITPELLKESEKAIRFYIYDGYDFGLDENVSYRLRKEWIDKNLPKYSKYYRKVHTDEVFSKVELDKIYNAYLADGEEGAIIRLPESSYEHKRSKHLLKYKPENDDEGVIIDIYEGSGDWAGAATPVLIEWQGKQFRGTFKGKYEIRVEILKNKADWIGKQVTFCYTGFTGLGTPNYARIDPDNCFKEDR